MENKILIYNDLEFNLTENIYKLYSELNHKERKIWLNMFESYILETNNNIDTAMKGYLMCNYFHTILSAIATISEIMRGEKNISPFYITAITHIIYIEEVLGNEIFDYTWNKFDEFKKINSFIYTDNLTNETKRIYFNSEGNTIEV